MDKIITVQDAQVHGFCIRGQRLLWSANAELAGEVTFKTFIKQGVTVRWLLETGNPYAVKLVSLVLGVTCDE